MDTANHFYSSRTVYDLSFNIVATSCWFKKRKLNKVFLISRELKYYLYYKNIRTHYLLLCISELLHNFSFVLSNRNRSASQRLLRPFITDLIFRLSLTMDWLAWNGQTTHKLFNERKNKRFNTNKQSTRDSIKITEISRTESVNHLLSKVMPFEYWKRQQSMDNGYLFKV